MTQSIHPGKVLNDQFLIPNDMSLEYVASHTGISENHLMEILMEKRAISEHTAKKLARFFHTSPDYWLALQDDYDLFMTKKILKGIIPENDSLESIS